MLRPRTITIMKCLSITMVMSMIIMTTYGVPVPGESLPPGSPGTRAVPDQYNTNGIWNRTYGPSEPQQIHMTWISDGEGCRIQFATHEEIDDAVLRYWPDDNSDKDLTYTIVKRIDVTSSHFFFISCFFFSPIQSSMMAHHTQYLNSFDISISIYYYIIPGMGIC